ncbi:MAG: HAD family phosphatase [Marivibrio sp.]|uniref:HAD family hydrolase n=1 Tax=Marivibrio sp. TaxID=2039719 RepID=UPI0032ED1544
MERFDAYLFDLGNVVIRWRPERLLADILGGPEAAAAFSRAIDLPALILDQDRGLSVAGAEAEVARRAPECLAAFQEYERRWVETIDGEIAETVRFLEALRADGRPVFALSNYAAEHMDWSEPHYPVLTSFDGRIVSAHEGVIKPEREIFERAIARFGLEPGRTLFIDDRPENAAAAQALGFRAHVFDPDRPRALGAALPPSDAALFATALGA